MRGSDCGRDRCRHEHLPNSGTFGLLGRNEPGQQRVRRSRQVDRDSARQPLPKSRAWRRRPVYRQQPRHLAAKYRRIAARRGPKKALVAIEHAILVAIWNMAHTGPLYDDPGADYYTRHDPNAPAAMR